MTFRGAFTGAGALVGAALVLGANTPPAVAPDTLGARLVARNAQPRPQAERYSDAQIQSELQMREKRQELADRAGQDLGLPGSVDAADLSAWIKSNAQLREQLDAKISKLDQRVAALESKKQDWLAAMQVEKEGGAAGAPSAKKTAAKASTWTQQDVEQLLADRQALDEARGLLSEDVRRGTQASELLQQLQAVEKELSKSALQPISAEELQETAVKRAVEKAIDGAVYSDEPRAIYWVEEGPRAVYNPSGDGGLLETVSAYGVPDGEPHLLGVCAGQPSCGVAAQISSSYLLATPEGPRVLVLAKPRFDDPYVTTFSPARRVSKCPVMGYDQHAYCAPSVMDAFVDQPAPATCSASLVDEQVLLTAAHCVDTSMGAKNLDEAALLDAWFVFGFFKPGLPAGANTTVTLALKPEGKVRIETRGYSFKPDQLYQAQGVVVDWDLDVAAIYLDREVASDYPRLRVGRNPAKDAQVHIVGTPLGLPLAHAWTTAHKLSVDRRHLEVRVDAFAGNSGSPLLDKGWDSIVAMLQSGERDAPEGPMAGCRTLFTYQNNGDAHENALLASEILTWAHTVPMAELARDQREAWRRAAGR